MNCYWRVITAYFLMLILASAVILSNKNRHKKSKGKTEGSKKKLGVYVLINLLMIGAAWAPYHIFTFLAGLIAGLASYEIADASRKKRNYRFISPFWYGLTSFVVVLAIDFLTALMLFKVIIFLIIIHLCLLTFYKMDKNLMPKVSLATMAVIYIPAFLGCLVALHIDDPTGFYLVFVYLVVAATDAFAEVSGELFGRRKFAPALSPNKTVEGAIGGLLAGAVIAAATACCLPGHKLWQVVMFGLIVSAASQLGDLIVSAWKRNLGIKDFSRLLGAHGGIIDRFDGVVFAAGVCYLLITGYQIFK